MSKPIKNKEMVGIPAYLIKLGEYIELSPQGIIHTNYIVQMDLAKDKAILERIQSDHQFAERFQISVLTPTKVEDVAKMKAGTVAITLKKAKA
jgi:hypothetical protein